jgi:hypothetical protein
MKTITMSYEEHEAMKNKIEDLEKNQNKVRITVLKCFYPDEIGTSYFYCENDDISEKIKQILNPIIKDKNDILKEVSESRDRIESLKSKNNELGLKISFLENRNLFKRILNVKENKEDA